jgi:hypothetical protein
MLPAMAAQLKSILTLLQLAPQALWHAAAMVFFRPLNPNRLGDKQLATMLGVKADAIKGYRWQPVHQGTTSRWRLHLPAQRLSLFAKTNPPDFATRFFGAMFELSLKELGFYRDLQNHLDIATPKSYGQFGNRYRYCILMEDLGGRAQFANVSDRCDLARAESVIDTLASLHASLWQDRRFAGEWRWVNRQEHRSNHAFLRLLREQASLQASRRYGKLLPEAIPELVNKLNKAYHRLQREWATGARTLVHGDAHVGNMFFLSDGSTGLLDWQVLGYEQGMRDVTYFIINSLPTEIRLRHQYALIDRYVDGLHDRGIEFTKALARSQYLTHVPYVWIASAVTAASNTMQEEKIAAAGLIRASRAMVDLDIEKIL